MDLQNCIYWCLWKILILNPCLNMNIARSTLNYSRFSPFPHYQNQCRMPDPNHSNSKLTSSATAPTKRPINHKNNNIFPHLSWTEKKRENLVIKSFFNQSSFIERNCSHFGKCITVSILMASQQYALSNEAIKLTKKWISHWVSVHSRVKLQNFFLKRKVPGCRELWNLNESFKK